MYAIQCEFRKWKKSFDFHNIFQQGFLQYSSLSDIPTCDSQGNEQQTHPQGDQFVFKLQGATDTSAANEISPRDNRDCITGRPFKHTFTHKFALLQCQLNLRIDSFLLQNNRAGLTGYRLIDSQGFTVLHHEQWHFKHMSTLAWGTTNSNVKGKFTTREASGL